MRWLTLTPLSALLATAAFIFGWQSSYWIAKSLSWHAAIDNAFFFGWSGLYLIGLAWVMFGLERIAQAKERQFREQADLGSFTNLNDLPPTDTWNPLDLQSWYFGKRGQRMKQTLLGSFLYSVVFFVLFLAVMLLNLVGKSEPYELPAGGGKDQAFQPQVRVKRVVQKKYVINPFSAILFNPPPLDQVDPKILDVTQNLYAVGQGEGEGSGFAKGTVKGKVRFIRLTHSDKSAEKNFGIGGDQNLLLEYHLRTRQNVSDKTEKIEVAVLNNFPPDKSPPLVYVAGAQTFRLSNADKKTLKNYIFEKHGMVLGDNLGGRSFHNEFISVMNEVTGVQPVAIPRDDYIHRKPFDLPALPIVVAHGGTIPLGWKVDGRWVAYYHPGALSDAWRDDHAGIKKEIYEECYMLGINIIFYAHAEYNKWLTQRQAKP